MTIRLLLLLFVLAGCVQTEPRGTTDRADPAAAAAKRSYVASVRGQVYYRSDCAAARRVPPDNRRYFASAKEAEATGYRASTAAGCGSNAAERPSEGEQAKRGSRRKSTPATGTASCVVDSVNDGDTLSCRDGTRVRLLLIDTPELAQEPYGGRARDALARIAPVDTRLRVETDVQPKDRYGRTLAYLWLPDGTMVNEEMARRGYALVLSYPPNVRYVDRVRGAVEQARRERRGLWGTPAFACSPRDFRAKRCA